MNRDEQSLIQNLFGKLSEAERTAPPREPEAERFIADSVSRQPGAPYYMAQTIIMQEQALEAAEARIRQLEAQPSRPQGAGGFFGSLFGGGSSAPAPRQPAQTAYAPQGAYGQPHGQGAPQNRGAWGGGAAAGAPGAYGAARSGGGGFLAGAAQTAMGVAGGMMLGSMLSNAFGADPAAAVEGAVADAGEAAETEMAGLEEDFGGFDEA